MIEETLGQQLRRELAGADFDASRRIIHETPNISEEERQRRLNRVSDEQAKKEAEIAGKIAVQGSEVPKESA